MRVFVLSNVLKFGRGNAKLDDTIHTFSLPAGHTCPFADKCLSKADRTTGKLTDGKRTEFRCYAASMECRRPSVRNSRWHNFDLLKACRSGKRMTDLILASLSPLAGHVRVHDSGDFFSQTYFDAWLDAAAARPATRFYAYTKALPFWGRRLDRAGTGRKPGSVRNFVLTASRGGTKDDLIDSLRLRSARVVYSHAEADHLGLDIDHDDSHAMRHGPDFALLIHGVQPSGTVASQAVSELRKRGWFGYGTRVELPLAV